MPARSFRPAPPTWCSRSCSDEGAAKTAYDSLKARVVKHGRAPEHVPILPGVMPIVGATEQEAKDKLNRLQSWLTPTNALTLVSQRLGHDISGYPLDGPVPDFPTQPRAVVRSRRRCSTWRAATT